MKVFKILLWKWIIWTEKFKSAENRYCGQSEEKIIYFEMRMSFVQ